jgi:dTDP-4-amino-4,6-dideoxygalactose transaminase
VDLKAQYAGIADGVQAAILAVLERTDFILGPDVVAFEEMFAEYCGVRHAVGCATGTDALHLAFRALDIGVGDEVIIPATTFAATALGVCLAGATPVLVDVDPDTALIDVACVKAAITDKTRAICPVHLFGQCADMAALTLLAREHGLRIVEDAAQAHGARYADGNRAGSAGDIGCFSFYPGKNLGAYGDGGALVTNDDALRARLNSLRNWGAGEKYHHDVIGMNSRLDTIQAAVLKIKLAHLDGWNAARRAHAQRYEAELEGLNGVTLTRYDSGAVHHLFVIRVAGDRRAVLTALNDAGIGAGMHYPFAIHELKAYADLGYAPGSFPVAEDWARRCISLPMYPELPHSTAERVRAVLQNVIET